jgi:hypothetical protein
MLFTLLYRYENLVLVHEGHVIMVIILFMRLQKMHHHVQWRYSYSGENLEVVPEKR